MPHKYSCSIQLLEFHLQDLPELPPHYHTTNGLPLHLQSTLYKALMMEKPQFYQILKDQKPDVLVFDIMQPWAVRVASSLNIPAIRYCNASAATCCYFGHLQLKPGVEFPFTALYLKDYEKEIERHIELEVVEEGERIMLLNSSRAIDAKYIDYLSEIGQSNILPTGVVIQDFEDAGDIKETELIKWIGKKEEHSTVFPRGEQVVNLEEALPQGFLDRIGERGRIVEGWAPQARILKHANQPMNARSVVENGIAVEIARDGNGKLHRGYIAETIKEVILGEKIGDDLRRRMNSLGENIRLLREEQMDEVAEVIKQLCEKNQFKNA
ncbi:hypothetical protein MTR67_024983 [Solanum verrucosum]|uniref:Uncharacterized protein n=1 Tax=Solanum verrucosum TaxID=315347 RepID=A0AAF0TZ77_SOLVR|nr:hypothetical protein MTR67_024983 [Solanum verrucosum]